VNCDDAALRETVRPDRVDAAPGLESAESRAYVCENKISMQFSGAVRSGRSTGMQVQPLGADECLYRTITTCAIALLGGIGGGAVCFTVAEHPEALDISLASWNKIVRKTFFDSLGSEFSKN